VDEDESGQGGANALRRPGTGRDSTRFPPDARRFRRKDPKIRVFSRKHDPSSR
jgi:hypothetical protein